MKNFFLLTIPFLFFYSCSSTRYYYQQAKGQFQLLWNARDNQIVLNDPSVKEEFKKKIRLVINAKEFFFKYFEIEQKSIYSKTTILNQDAVSYLVTVSPFDEVRPMIHSFPIVGSFPYIGFYKRQSALDYADEKKSEGNQIYVRPVYAYSSLGYFTDPILSSFFRFDDDDLVEMVFHELFHLIFFVKNQVETNEQLADFFSQRMLVKYGMKKKKNKTSFFLDKISFFARELDNEYKKIKNKNREEFLNKQQEFIKTRFMPQMQKLCQQENIDLNQCFVLKIPWNNATFASYEVYHHVKKDWQKTYEKMNFSIHGDKDLFRFWQWLKENYK